MAENFRMGKDAPDVGHFFFFSFEANIINYHYSECNQPMLLKFEGRPKDITPKARIRSWFG